MHRSTHNGWADVLRGLVSGIALTALIVVAGAAWYIGPLGAEAPVLWDGYAVWFTARALSLALAARLQGRRPVFAGAMSTGACGLALLLVVALWLLDNAIGFSG